MQLVTEKRGGFVAASLARWQKQTNLKQNGTIQNRLDSPEDLQARNRRSVCVVRNIPHVPMPLYCTCCPHQTKRYLVCQRKNIPVLHVTKQKLTNLHRNVELYLVCVGVILSH